VDNGLAARFRDARPSRHSVMLLDSDVSTAELFRMAQATISLLGCENAGGWEIAVIADIARHGMEIATKTSLCNPGRAIAIFRRITDDGDDAR